MPLLLALLLLTTTAHASDGDRTIRLLTQETTRLKGVVGTLFKQQQQAVAGCTDVQSLQAQEIWVLSDPLFDLNGHPTAGQWQVRYTVTLCGQPRTRTVLFTGHSSGQTEAISLQPGSTLATKQLGDDVWKSFQAAAVKIVPGCTRMAVKETSVTQSPTSTTSLWRELWVARVCTQDVAQQVTFYPSKVGTIFRMSVPKNTLPTPTPTATSQPL